MVLSIYKKKEKYEPSTLSCSEIDRRVSLFSRLEYETYINVNDNRRVENS